MSASSPRPTDAGRRRRQAGQSVVELALGVPVMMVMLYGMLNLAALITDKVAAAYAARQGARLAAVLGNGGASGLNTLQIDQNVCQAVKAATANFAYATVTEVDVYQADVGGSTTGTFSTGLPYNSYDPNSSPPCNQTHSGFANTARNQVPPSETSIGVNVKWQFTMPIGYTSFTPP